MRHWFLIICLLTFTFLYGCAQEADFPGELDDYRKRLNRVLDLEIPRPTFARQSLRPPQPRALERQIPRLTVNFWQFLQLSDCELNRVIGEHNSILNRHQGASEALFHDASFVFLAQVCIEQAIDPNAKPLPLLARALIAKRESFASRLANATLASQEFENFFSVHTRLQPPAAIAAQAPEIAEAIATLARISAQLTAAVAEGSPPPSNDRSRFDNALGQLQTHKFAGQVLAFMHLTSVHLNGISEFVEAALAADTVCPGNLPNGRVLLHPRRASALEYLFRQIYLTSIQPSISTLDKAARVVQQMESLTALFARHVPDEFQRYWFTHWSFATDSQFRQFRRAVRRHSAMWQKLLAQCDILQLPPIELHPERDP